jgi:REP element-mobilizing transposase RayT
MGRPLRFLPPETPLVEITCRTLQGRYLLRPSKRLNLTSVGVLARAARIHEMAVCGYSFLSNHYHLLLAPKSAAQQAAFMNYFNGNLAREAGRLHSWRDKFWGRRYRAIPVSYEPEAQVARLRYLLEQGCKENLVARPEDWPGATCLRALLTGESVRGLWRDRTAECRARQQSRKVEVGDFLIEETLALSPLPCWDELSPEETQELVQELVRQISRETAQRVRSTGIPPLGRRRVLRLNPHARPERVERSPAPLFHAATRAVRQMLSLLYRTYLERRTQALAALRALSLVARLPQHGIPPPVL